ncbi:hypothetical protein GCM10022286_13720 [Gryllotalpicola daejeonensis]|uniref:Uncharacterized protein n=1 Tax=Gryllotalpicola daejeonensis TaxID=993087 RepID=A0ABP7ZIX6_9MICO
MTQPDASTPDVCPICGTTLVERGHALYCGNCDLYYEEDEHLGGGGGQGSGAEPQT